VSRAYTKSSARWDENHDRWEAKRRERRALWHEFLPDKRVGVDGCRVCGAAWEAAVHTPVGY
jgi:hypothetical protein